MKSPQGVSKPSAAKAPPAKAPTSAAGKAPPTAAAGKGLPLAGKILTRRGASLGTSEPSRLGNSVRPLPVTPGPRNPAADPVTPSSVRRELFPVASHELENASWPFPGVDQIEFQPFYQLSDNVLVPEPVVFDGFSMEVEGCESTSSTQEEVSCVVESLYPRLVPCREFSRGYLFAPELDGIVAGNSSTQEEEVACVVEPPQSVLPVPGPASFPLVSDHFGRDRPLVVINAPPADLLCRHVGDRIMLTDIGSDYLMALIQQSHFDSIGFFLQQFGSALNINYIDHRGRIPLHEATHSYPIMYLLISMFGADPDFKNAQGLCALMVMMCKRQHSEGAQIERWLLTEMYNPSEAIDNQGFTLLHYATFSYDWEPKELIAEMIKQGVKLNKISQDTVNAGPGRKAIDCAAPKGWYQTVKALLQLRSIPVLAPHPEGLARIGALCTKATELEKRTVHDRWIINQVLALFPEDGLRDPFNKLVKPSLSYEQRIGEALARLEEHFIADRITERMKFQEYQSVVKFLMICRASLPI